MPDKLAANVWKLTLTRSLMTAYVHLPVIVLFWQDNGLSLTEIMLLQSAFAITSVALEVPSGIFADLYGRKRAIVLAAVFNAAGIAIYALATDFTGFLIGEVAMAVFVSLVSGADSALLYESLRASGRENQFARRYGSLIFVQTLVLGAANVAGGFIGGIELRYTLYAVLPFALAAVLISLTLTEPPRVQRLGGRGLKPQLQEIHRVIRRDHGLAWLLVYAGIVLAFNQAGLWLYQPYFAVTGVDVVWFGLIFASFQLVSGLTSKYGYLVSRRLGALNSVYLLIFLSSLASLLLGNLLFAFSFLFIYGHQIVRGLYKVLFNAVVNERVESDVRASMLSVQNLTGRVVIALIGPIFGWYADAFSVAETFTLIGLSGLAAGVPTVLALRWTLARQAMAPSPSAGVHSAAVSGGPQADD